MPVSLEDTLILARDSVHARPKPASLSRSLCLAPSLQSTGFHFWKNAIDGWELSFLQPLLTLAMTQTHRTQVCLMLWRTPPVVAKR